MNFYFFVLWEFSNWTVDLSPFACYPCPTNMFAQFTSQHCIPQMLRSVTLVNDSDPQWLVHNMFALVRVRWSYKRSRNSRKNLWNVLLLWKWEVLKHLAVMFKMGRTYQRDTKKCKIVLNLSLRFTQDYTVRGYTVIIPQYDSSVWRISRF